MGKRIYAPWKRNVDGLCINKDGKPRLNSTGIRKGARQRSLNKDKASHRLMIFGDYPDELV